MFTDENGEIQTLDPKTPVSMNLWGFTPDYFDYSDREFRKFLDKDINTPKAEFFIPLCIDALINSGEATVKVLDTDSKWFGVTYAADRPGVVAKFANCIRTAHIPRNCSKSNTEMKPRILVTGGTGYIGSHTVVELQQAGYPVVIIDNLSNSNREVIDGIERITGIRPDFVEADCTDMAAVKELFDKYPGIKGIINFAASKAVGESMHKPVLYYRNNLNTLMNLLDIMGERDVKGIVFSSSCTVYGEPDVNPVTEASPIKKGYIALWQHKADFRGNHNRRD